MKGMRFLLPLVLFLGLAAIFAVGLRRDPREVPSPLVGKPAPDFALPSLNDGSRTLRHADLMGRPWMLNVWASWCGACREEHPVLLDFAREKRLPIYGLNYKDTREEGRQWLSDRGDPYVDSLFDSAGRVGLDFGVYGVPETFVIDGKGVIRYKHIGPLTPQILREHIEPLLRTMQ